MLDTYNTMDGHLVKVNVTYTEHMYQSLTLSRIFLIAFAKALVHSFVPNVFDSSSTEAVQQLNNLIKTNIDVATQTTERHKKNGRFLGMI